MPRTRSSDTQIKITHVSIESLRHITKTAHASPLPRPLGEHQVVETGDVLEHHGMHRATIAILVSTHLPNLHLSYTVLDDDALAGMAMVSLFLSLRQRSPMRFLHRNRQ